MRQLLLILAMLFSVTATADTLRYSSFSMAPTPKEISQGLRLEFIEQGFSSLVNNDQGIPSLGINQVFFKTENQFVLLKYGIQGSFPLDEILQTPTGFMVHKSIKDQKVMFYFRGFNQEFVKVVMNKISNNVSSFQILKGLLIPTAQASDCSSAFGAPVLNQTAELQSISSAAGWESLKSCITGAGQGLKEATVGTVTGVAKEAWSAVTHPIDYVEDIANKVELFLGKTSQFMKGLIVDPSGTLSQVGHGLGVAWDNVAQTISGMSHEMKVKFVCTFVAALGFEATLNFLTGGAASAKILLTIKNLYQKFSKIGKLMRVLNKLNGQLLSKLNLQGAKLEKFMDGLFNGHLPDDDLIHLDELAHMNDELSLRTLSCYLR